MIDESMKRVEAILSERFEVEMPLSQTVFDAMKYSLTLPGKRVRPRLSLLFCEACGADADRAVAVACAVEMIHTYSLIHDDLPCMDDDDYRRGKPSNHKVFGESMAVLAGDGLQSDAYALILDEENVRRIGADRAAAAGRVLSRKSGAWGMVGGQTTDIMSEGKDVDVNTLRFMDQNKTSALIEAACMMGCIAAGCTPDQLSAAETYGYYIGIAFQIMDDILDVTSTTEELGKPVGSDSENKKSTYVSLLGIERCRELVAEYTARAIDALSAFDGDTTDLRGFALSLAQRKK